MASSATQIEHPEKIGIGTWDADKVGSAIDHVEDLGFGWYYNWQPSQLWNPDHSPASSDFVPMIWDETSVTAAKLDAVAASGADALLGFNEPNLGSQANMSVAEALSLWPALMETGKRLGSPALTTSQTIGNGTWLDQFMDGAAARGLRVDFVAVHYYSSNLDVGAFKSWLQDVHAAYGKPIWVTEWALIDWTNLDRFTATEIASFARQAVLMMDDLDFVERHAWFSAYDDGTGLATELFDAAGRLTKAGRVFSELVGAADEGPLDFSGGSSRDNVIGTTYADDIATGGGADAVHGGARSDSIAGGGGNDVLRGGAGGDWLAGGEGADLIFGAWGDDTIKGGAGADKLSGGAGADVMSGGTGADIFVFSALTDSGVTAASRDIILDFTTDDRIDMSLVDAIAGGQDNEFVLGFSGDAGAGQIRQSLRPDGLYLEAHVDGDGKADFSLFLRGQTSLLEADDFIL